MEETGGNIFFQKMTFLIFENIHVRKFLKTFRENPKKKIIEKNFLKKFKIWKQISGLVKLTQSDGRSQTNRQQLHREESKMAFLILGKIHIKIFLNF